MHYTSLIFYIYFFVFSILYFSTKGYLRILICLLGSYFFYGWWDFRFLLLLFFLTLFNFKFSQIIYDEHCLSKKKTYLIISLIGNLGVLCFFKYFNFFIETANHFFTYFGLSLNFLCLNLILPVGISFYVFQSISYIIDVYNKKNAVERSFIYFAAYISFFPHLLSGPIIRGEDLLPQLHQDNKFNWSQFLYSCTFIAWGLILKLVLADSLSPVVNAQFATPEEMTSLSLSIGVFFYSFQIYGDFAGYSFMAIGFAMFFGYKYKSNFNRPYFSTSFSEFWNRWHISLSSWIKDYLYIPLGGNRISTYRTKINLLFSMLLCGLWHGASWPFVIWGFLHGIFLVVNQICKKALYRYQYVKFFIPKQLLNTFLIAVTFFFTSIAWIFFRSDTFIDAIKIISYICFEGNWDFAYVGQKFKVVKGLIFIFILYTFEALSFCINMKNILINNNVIVGILLIFSVIVLLLFGTYTGNSFFYFNF